MLCIYVIFNKICITLQIVDAYEFLRMGNKTGLRLFKILDRYSIYLAMRSLTNDEN